MKTFYLTTPLYYVNAKPHIGHAYTEVAADALARFKRLEGTDVFFLTGTDEHGQKVVKAAEGAGQTPQVFVDHLAQAFIDAWKALNISYDDFIRTTAPRHTAGVQEVLKQLDQQGEIYASMYRGWYCTPCETFWTELQLANGQCPDCKRAVEKIEEENYFFRLSKYQEWLMGHLRAHPDAIKPTSRYNETLGALRQPLNDLCISRPTSRLTWGIPMPMSQEHVTYVWFEALMNYITAPGYPRDQKRFQTLWPADLHIIGKDILRPHAIYWPIMLHAIGLEPPRMIFAHGWWTIKGEKISKSRGNIVDPLEVVKAFGVDAWRYFLLREVPFGQDGVYEEGALVNRFNHDLANDLGNLVFRSLSMVERYAAGRVPKASVWQAPEQALQQMAAHLPDRLSAAMRELEFSAALTMIWEFVDRANTYINEQAPWKLSGERLHTVLAALVESLRVVAIAISPFMPTIASQIWQQLGVTTPLPQARLRDLAQWGVLPAGQALTKGQPLFPRME